MLALSIKWKGAEHVKELKKKKKKKKNLPLNLSGLLYFELFRFETSLRQPNLVFFGKPHKLSSKRFETVLSVTRCLLFEEIVGLFETFRFDLAFSVLIFLLIGSKIRLKKNALLLAWLTFRFFCTSLMVSANYYACHALREALVECIFFRAVGATRKKELHLAT